MAGMPILAIHGVRRKPSVLNEGTPAAPLAVVHGRAKASETENHGSQNSGKR